MTATVAAGRSLQRAENWLDRAVDDLTGRGSGAPGFRSPVLLAEALAELQSFATLLAEPSLDQKILLPQVKNLLPRLRLAERLWAASAEFYSGWCAAGPPPAYPALGCYQIDQLSHGPALIALEA
jgi:hypothetical protein